MPVLAALVALALPGLAQADVQIQTSAGVRGLAWATASAVFGGANGLRAEGTFASTTDRGAVWMPTRNGEVAGADPQLRWAIGGSGVLASTDAGANWHSLPSFASRFDQFAMGREFHAVHQLLADPARQGVVYAIIDAGTSKGSVLSVLESSDAGASWSLWRQSIGKLGSYVSFVAATPVPGRDALLVELINSRPHLRDELETATPSGVRITGAWKTARRPTHRSFTGQIAVDRSGRSVLVGTTDRGWLLSTDGGAHVHALGKPLSYVAFDLSGKGRLFALRGGAVWHSSDNGRHWRRRARLAGASGLAADRGGALVYAYGASLVWTSRDAGATFRQLGAFIGPATVGEAPQLAPAGNVVLGSLPGSVPEVDQAPHPGAIASAPTGDAVVISGGTSSDVRSADGTWHAEPLTGDVDSLPGMSSHGVAYLANALDETGPGTGIQYAIQVSTHAPAGTWTPWQTIATTSQSVTGRQVVAADAAGDVLVTWIGDGIWATILRAGAAGWSPPVKISGDDVLPQPSLLGSQLGTVLAAGGGAGTFVVVWDGAPPMDTGTSVARTARIGATGDWSSPVDLFPLPGSALAPVVDSALAVDAAGNGLILAPTTAGPESFALLPGSPAWTAGVPLAPPAVPGASNGQPALALAPDGSATAVYTHADAHELVLRATTSHAPYTAWSPDADDVADAEACPAGDCLTTAPAAALYTSCPTLCVADGLPPVVASDASRTVAALETSRGLLVLSRGAGEAGWRPAGGGGGDIALAGAVQNGAVPVRVSCAVAPCTAAIVLETAAGSPLGDRVQIATSSVSIPDTGAVTRTLVLPAWAAAALQAADGLPVRLVLEASGAGLAWPVVARDATLSAQTI